MMRLERFALLVGACALMNACKSQAETTRAEQAALNGREKRLEARLARVEQTQSLDEPVAMWIMPAALAEISGIAVTPDDVFSLTMMSLRESSRSIPGAA